MATEIVQHGEAGLYRDGQLIASAAEVERAGYDLDALTADVASLKRAEAAVDRMRAMPVPRQINYEDDGDVLWA